MIAEAWLNFSVVIIVQLIFFLVCASYHKRLREVPKILLRGMIIGVIVGLIYDHLLGKYLGLFSYELGFGFFFLLLNAGLSYGLFAANTLVLKNVTTIYFLVWTSLLVAVYETVNYFFSVWRYEFTLPSLPLFLILILGYASGSLLVSLIAYKVFKYKFVLKLDN